VSTGNEEGKVSAQAVSEWFESVLAGSVSKQSLGPWLHPVKALTRAQEPPEDPWTANVRIVEYHTTCVMVSACRAKQVQALSLHIAHRLQDVGLDSLWLKFMDMDPFFKIFVALMTVLITYFSTNSLRVAAFGHKVKGSEEWTVSHMKLLVPVDLARTPGQKFGIGIWKASGGGLTVTGVDHDGLLHEWNKKQPQQGRQVGEGDRIVFASGLVNGMPLKTQAAKEMVQVLQGERANLIVERMPEKHKMTRIVGTCTLQDLKLQGNVELKENRGMTTDWEVVELKPEINHWNHQMKSNGACCTQCLAAGDRIVSINGSMDVKSQLETVSPCILLVRWRPAENIHPKRIEVNMEKSTPEDRWGMQVRKRVIDPQQMEVLEVIDTGVLARWNSMPGNEPIFKGDRIISANGLTEYTAIANSLQESKLKLVFERWTDSTPHNSDEFYTKARRKASLAHIPDALALAAMAVDKEAEKGSDSENSDVDDDMLGTDSDDDGKADAKAAPMVKTNSTSSVGSALKAEDSPSKPNRRVSFSGADNDVDSQITPPVTQSRPSSREKESRGPSSREQELGRKVRELEAALAEKDRLLAQRPIAAPSVAPPPLFTAPPAAPSAPAAPVAPVVASSGGPGLEMPSAPLAAAFCIACFLLVEQRRVLKPAVESALQSIPFTAHLLISGALLLVGVVACIFFLRGELSGRGVLSQICVSVIASFLLGFGLFFTMTWAGIYS
jgi:hypothetical protein